MWHHKYYSTLDCYHSFFGCTHANLFCYFYYFDTWNYYYYFNTWNYTTSCMILLAITLKILLVDFFFYRHWPTEERLLFPHYRKRRNAEGPPHHLNISYCHPLVFMCIQATMSSDITKHCYTTSLSFNIWCTLCTVLGFTKWVQFPNPYSISLHLYSRQTCLWGCWIPDCIPPYNTRTIWNTQTHIVSEP